MIRHHTVTYVAAIINNDYAILMKPSSNGRTIMTIRITPDTFFVNSSDSVDCSTLFLTQEVWVYEHYPIPEDEKDQQLPAWMSQRVAREVHPCQPVPTTIKTIGFVYKNVCDGLYTIVSDETPFGFMVDNFNVPLVDSTTGEMFKVFAYKLRRGTTVYELPHLNFYASDPADVSSEEIFSSDIVALAGITTITQDEINFCRDKRSSTRQLTTAEYKLFVGRGSASMAAFEIFMTNIRNNRCTFQVSARIARNTAGLFQSKFSFNYNFEDISEVWAPGAKTMALFHGSSHSPPSYSTSVEIRRFRKKRGRAEAIVIFTKAAENFLTSWCRVATDDDFITYGPLDFADYTPYISIRERFEALIGTKVFRQYTSVEKPIRSAQWITERQKVVGEITLDEFQAEAMKTLLYTDGIALIQAPPGSGKTVLVAAATREFLLKKEAKTIVFTGTTNIAVDNALAALESISEELDDFRPIRIASQRAMCHSADLEENWSQKAKAMRFEEHISSRRNRHILAKLRRKVVKLKIKARQPASSAEIVVDRYAKVRIAETILEDAFVEMYNPNVIATTTSLLLRNRTKPSFENATHILIDEASQLAPTEFLAILAAFPNLKKVAIIGDEHQLKPQLKLKEDSNAKFCFGTSDLVRLNQQFGGAATKLRKIYRSHPQIALNLINTFYPYELEAGTRAEDRNMAIRLGLPICSDGTPVRAYHVDGRENSGKNKIEGRTILAFVNELLEKNVRAEDILVLTFHRNQRSFLSFLLPDGVCVKTVDSAQGQQSPITIIATTKTRNSNSLSVLKFIANPNRATVALSRSLEATYIFGNLRQLRTTDFWSPVIGSIDARLGLSNAPQVVSPN